MNGYTIKRMPEFDLWFESIKDGLRAFAWLNAWTRHSEDCWVMLNPLEKECSKCESFSDQAGDFTMWSATVR